MQYTTQFNYKCIAVVADRITVYPHFGTVISAVPVCSTIMYKTGTSAVMGNFSSITTDLFIKCSLGSH